MYSAGNSSKDLKQKVRDGNKDPWQTESFYTEREIVSWEKLRDP